MQQNSISKKINQTFIIWLIVISALSFFAFLYKESIRTLFNIWNEYGTYSHGYLTVMLFVYLIFICVKENRIIYSKPSVVSLICLVLTSMLWLVSYLSGINIGQTLCLPIFIFFTITYFLGFRDYRALVTPILILLLVMPIWGVLLPFLQGAAVYLVNGLLSFTSLEYQSIGNKIILPLGVFVIEESCSGLRFLLVGVLLSVVFGFLNYKSCWSTIVLVLYSVLIMLIANIVRILIIVAIGVEKGMDYPLVQDHASLGWIIFAVFLVPLFGFARYLNPNLLGVKKEKIVVKDKGDFVFSHMFVAITLYVMVVSVAPLYAQYAEENIGKVAEIDNHINMIGGWNKLDFNKSKWELNYILYSHRYNAEYSKYENKVDLGVYLYTKEIPNSELVNFNNTLVDKSKWKVENYSGNQLIMLEGLPSFYVNKATIESDVFNECKRVWFWFDVDGKTYAKGWKVKLSEALLVVRGKSGAAVNALSTRCGEGSDKVLSDFLSVNIFQINKLIIW